MPTPIEIEDGEIMAPVLPPDSAEIQPRSADPMREFTDPAALDAPMPSTQQHSAQDYVPDAPDPVRQLGASALSTASLEAAGAPTPRGGVPLIGVEREGMPSFGEEEPFVPRFEPLGRVVPAAVPTVSFTTPKPPAQPMSPMSPLSDFRIPESDEPAYMPMEQFEETELSSFNDDESFADATAVDPFAPPARPWSTVDPAEVEFVGGEQIAVEVGAFGPETPDPVADLGDRPSRDSFAPTAPSWEGIMGGASTAVESPAAFDAPAAAAPGMFPPVSDSADAPSEAPAPIETAGGQIETEGGPFETEGTPISDDPAATPVIPVSPVASFFAATAARNARRVDDMEGALPANPMGDQALPDESSPRPTTAEPLFSEPFHATPPDSLRAEPVHTAATPYTPSTGEWARPAFAHADAVTQVNGMAPLGDTTEIDATDAATLAAASAGDQATGENAMAAVATQKTHRRRRLVLWIVLGTVIAAGAGILVYRLAFLPEPVTLPVPTVTAQAPTPTAEPVKIADSSDFVAAMPTTVGTNVLMDYVVTDTVGDTTLPARAAEHVTLKYGPGSSSMPFTVEAYQHYNADDAKTAYGSYATGSTDVKDVTVDGTNVGQRAYSTSGSTGTVVWRNGTAVFDLTGPSDDVLAFYEHFGI